MLSQLATLLLLLVACAPAVAPGPTTPPTPVVAAPPTHAPDAASRVTLPKPERTSLKIGLTTLEPSQLAIPFAVDLGLFKKYGIDNVETVYFDGDARGFQSLVGGQVDASLQSTGAAISSLVGDTPIVIVAMTATMLTDNLVAARDIKSAADLKGGKIAVSTFGSTSHGSTLLSLKALGLTPDDVTIVQIGGQSARIAALQAGSVAAAPIDIALEDEMKKQGFNILVRLPDTPLEFGRSGLALRRDWAPQNPNTMLALLAAMLEAQNAIWTQTDRAVDSFARWAQIKEPLKAEEQVKTFLKTGRRDLRWSKDAFALAQEVQSITNPAIKGLDVTKAYDMQWLDILQAMGFNSAIGNPGS